MESNNICSTIDGLRTYRIFDFAIFDWSVALIGGLLIGEYILRLNTLLHWILWIILWFIIGIVSHVIMKIPTMLGYYIGLNEKPIIKTC
jgi:hypothetical protein